MSLRALGRQFTDVAKTGAKKVKEVNDYLKEDEHMKLHEAPLRTEYLHFDSPAKQGE